MGGDAFLPDDSCRWHERKKGGTVGLGGVYVETHCMQCVSTTFDLSHDHLSDHPSYLHDVNAFREFRSHRKSHETFVTHGEVY